MNARNVLKFIEHFIDIDREMRENDRFIDVNEEATENDH